MHLDVIQAAHSLRSQAYRLCSRWSDNVKHLHEASLQRELKHSFAFSMRVLSMTLIVSSYARIGNFLKSTSKLKMHDLLCIQASMTRHEDQELQRIKSK